MGLPIPGPLNTDRFLLVKTGSAGEPGTLAKGDLPSVKTGNVPSADGGARRETRILDGSAPPVGVAGRTLTDECGERARRAEAVERPDGDATEALEVLEAFECEWW